MNLLSKAEDLRKKGELDELIDFLSSIILSDEQERKSEAKKFIRDNEKLLREFIEDQSRYVQRIIEMDDNLESEEVSLVISIFCTAYAYFFCTENLDEIWDLFSKDDINTITLNYKKNVIGTINNIQKFNKNIPTPSFY